MKADKVLLLYNPHAGNGLFKENLDRIIEKFQQKNLQVMPYRVSKPEVMKEMLLRNFKNTIKKVIIAGGDGTINLCINALIEADYDVPVAIFPVGTANDFAHYFNLPIKLDDMIRIALKENYTYADVGRINDKYFVNVASLGFLVDISQRTDPKAKTALGVASYYLKGIEELPGMKPIPIEITSEEFSLKEEIFFMLIMNGRSAGGFKKIAPDATVNDGLLDVIIFKKCPIIELMPLLVDVFRGNHHFNPHVAHFKTAELTIDCKTYAGTDIDGEKGPEFPLHIRIKSKRLKINTLVNDMEGNIW